METMQENVVVVGTGVIGLSTALAIQVLGYRVTLIDPVGYDTARPHEWSSRVSAIAHTHLAWLYECGLKEADLNRFMCPFNAMTVWHDRSAGWIDFALPDGMDSHRGHAEQPLLGAIVDNKALVNALALCCRQKAIPCIAARVESISCSAEGAQVALSTGETIRTSLIVGADGVDSTIRRLAGIRRQWSDTGQSAIVANLACDRSHDHTARQLFLSSGPLAYLPITSGENEPTHVSIVWTVDRHLVPELAALTDEAFCVRVHAHAHDYFGSMTLSSGRMIIPLHQSHANAYTTHGIVLVGDAAHQIHPMAGQGANLGFADVRCLISWLKQAKRCSTLAARRVYLRRYEAERRLVNQSALTLMTALQTLYAIEHPIGCSALGLGMNQFNRWPVFKHLARRFAGSEVAS